MAIIKPTMFVFLINQIYFYITNNLAIKNGNQNSPVTYYDGIAWLFEY